jgi:hypothetical protein
VLAVPTALGIAFFRFADQEAVAVVIHQLFVPTMVLPRAAAGSVIGEVVRLAADDSVRVEAASRWTGSTIAPW